MNTVLDEESDEKQVRHPQLPEGTDAATYTNPYMYNYMGDSGADKAKATFEEKYDYTEQSEYLYGGIR